MVELFANSRDTDQNASSDLGLHCLQFSLLDYNGLILFWLKKYLDMSQVDQILYM